MCFEKGFVAIVSVVGLFGMASGALADESRVKDQIAKLASRDSTERSAAAAELRRLLAGDFDAVTNNRGRLYWEERLRQVKPDMKHEEVLKILPPVDKNISGNWSGGTGNQHWRLDDYWTVGVHYHYPDVVHEMRPQLQARVRDVWVDPPDGFTGKWTTWYVNGQKARESELTNGKSHGVLRSHHDNGRVAFEQHYVNGTCHGSDRGWYADGGKMYEGQYADDKRDGIWTHWYANGQLQSRQTMRLGQSHGGSTLWHENGQKQQVTNYQDGKQHGQDMAWDMEGKLLWSRMHRDGQVVD